MPRLKFRAPLGLAVLLAACQSPAPLGPLPIPVKGAVQAIGHAALKASSPFARPRLQSTSTTYTREDIDHLVLQLFILDSGSESLVLDSDGWPVRTSVPQSMLDSPVTFSNLRANTTYRLRAFAYLSPGEAEEDLISTTDAGSYVDVTVGADGELTVTTLPVQLIDKPFSAEGEADLDIHDGHLVTTEAESFGFGSLPSPGASVAPEPSPTPEDSPSPEPSVEPSPSPEGQP